MLLIIFFLILNDEFLLEYYRQPCSNGAANDWQPTTGNWRFVGLLILKINFKVTEFIHRI